MIMGSSAEIFVSFTEQAIHCWPGAPNHRAYLRDPHRHLFNVTARTTVTHDDREIEFHDLLDVAKELFIGLRPLNSRSCEHIARTVAAGLVKRYQRQFIVMVWEDGECGASVEVLP